MTACRSLALLAALAVAVVAGRDALGQAGGGGTNQLSTQDTPGGSEAARVNKIEAITIKQGAADGASKDAAIKGESRAIKGEAIKGAYKSDAIKGEASKDGILIGLTPKPEADASMSGGGAPGAARSGPSAIIGPVDQKAAIIGPVDQKAGGIIAPTDMRSGLAPPPPGVVSGPAAVAPAQANLPAVQAPGAIKQAPALPPGGAFGGPGAPGMIKR
ncbi:MAG TPA: hypothetical protein VML91_25645 [Burkholderiales bacterium]|nr:hypothetical protein [Burkholderiales bacterium]